jgi:hypothetical protein
MIKYITILLLFPLSVLAADVSEYQPVGEMQNLAGYTDLSGGAYSPIYGATYVDNKSGMVSFSDSPTQCASGGDLEAVEYLDDHRVYTVNEAKNGVSVINVSNCSVERRFFVNIPKTGSDGIEGLTVHNGIVYVLDERSSSIYSFVDTGGNRNTITPDFLFSVSGCTNGGDLAMNGDNIVIVCESSPNIVEYDLFGNWVASNNLVTFINTEVIYFNDNQMCAGGEPDQLQCFESSNTPPPPPPVDEFETCTYSGEVVVNVETGAFDPQTVVFNCPTITASGTLN